MGIDRSLLNEFVKITNDKKETKQTQLYGTVVTQGNSKYVKIDGSEIITPVRSTTDIKDDERVIVKIDNHMATITGNMTNPSVGNDRVEFTEGKIDRFDHLFAGNITAENIAANSITSDKILAGSITTDKLMAESIIADKIAADAIESKHIKANAIEAEHIKAGAITADKIDAGIITSDHISSGTITADKIATGTITAGSGVIADGAIGSAQISSLDVAKLESGTIDTSKIYIAGADGHLQLKGNRLQVFDGLGNRAVERVSVGDVNGDGSKFGLRVRGADGETILLDENGVTSEGITDGSITNNKISDDANIDGAKLNINSVVSKINEDGTETIQGTKIEVDGTTLNTKLSTITNKQTEDGERITQAQSQISANTNAIKLKVDEQTYTTDKKDMTSKLEKNTSEISTMKGQIALKVERTDIENAKSEIEGVIDTKVNSAKAEMKITTDAISQNVSNLTQTVSNKADGSTVSSLNSKVSSLETGVNGISGKVTSLEKTTTTLGTQVDAANTTANNAQNTANTNKNNITDLQGEVSTVKSNVASLEVTTSGISQKVSSVESTTATLSGKVNTANSNATNAINKANDANAKVDGIQVGGRNLLLNSGNFKDTSQWFLNGGSNLRVENKDGFSCLSATGSVKHNAIKLEPYTKYIYWTEIMFNTDVSVNNIIPLHYWLRSMPSGTTKGSVSIVSGSGTAKANKWNKIVLQITTGSLVNGDTHIELTPFIYKNPMPESWWMKYIKVEKGTKATDWSPAPEDVQSQIDTHTTQITTTNNKVSEIKTDLNGITSRVGTVESKQTTTDGKITGLETRMTTAESKITESAITNTVKKNFYTKTETDSQITSKGYQTASQVQQTVNQLEVKFSTSGGYNLLYNGNFERGLEHWALTNASYGYVWVQRNDNGSPNNPLELYMQGALDGEHRYANQSFGWDSNEALTLSWIQFTTAIGKDGSNVYRGTQVTITYTDGTKSWHTSGNQTELDVWQKRSMTVYPDAEKRVSWVSVDMWCRDTSKVTLYTDIMLEKGEVATNWTPNPNEVYDGITTIDNKGITVRQSNISTYTTMDASSFRVENNTGGTVAEFSQNSQIPNLTAGIISADNVYASNICSKSPKAGDIHFIYVNGSTGNDNGAGTSSSPYKTVQRAIDNIKDKQDQSVTIYVYNSVPGFDLKGITGTGVITLSLQDSAIVNGYVVLGGVTNAIRITNETGSLKATFKNGISIFRCVNVDIYGVTFRGLNAQGSNIFIQDTNYCAVNTCDLGGMSSSMHNAIETQASKLWFYNCQGSNITYPILMRAFSQVYLPRAGTSKVPDYTGVTIVANGDGGERVYSTAGGTFTKTPSSGWNPTYTPTQKTQTWSFNKIWSDETLHGWSDRQELIQGYATTWNTGRWTGYIQMTDDFSGIRNIISGGTNLSGRIYIQRTSSSGNSTGSKLCLYGSDGTLITNSTSINRGQGVWVSLTSSIIQKIQSGAIRYFYLKADANNSSTYFKCERNCKIEITYTK